MLFRSSSKGDPLERLEKVVDFECFRPTLNRIFKYELKNPRDYALREINFMLENHRDETNRSLDDLLESRRERGKLYESNEYPFLLAVPVISLNNGKNISMLLDEAKEFYGALEQMKVPK